ncbi:MAG: hypothetical protein NVSMB52_06980 [Chloroflexota bacterium]
MAEVLTFPWVPLWAVSLTTTLATILRTPRRSVVAFIVRRGIGANAYGTPVPTLTSRRLPPRAPETETDYRIPDSGIEKIREADRQNMRKLGADATRSKV